MANLLRIAILGIKQMFIELFRIIILLNGNRGTSSLFFGTVVLSFSYQKTFFMTKKTFGQIAIEKLAFDARNDSL